MIIYKSILILLILLNPKEILHECEESISKFDNRTTTYDSIYEITDQIALDLESTYKLLCFRRSRQENRALFVEEKNEYKAILKDKHYKTFRKKLCEILCREVV